MRLNPHLSMRSLKASVLSPSELMNASPCQVGTQHGDTSRAVLASFLPQLPLLLRTSSLSWCCFHFAAVPSEVLLSMRWTP
jgi:hypothetical protein